MTSVNPRKLSHELDIEPRESSIAHREPPPGSFVSIAANRAVRGSSDLDRHDRIVHALSRFVFPNHLVPRAEMAEAVLAALDHGDDYADYLPAKRIVTKGSDR